MTFHYFAYGSNMLTERLKAHNRCPDATKLGTAYVEGAIIEFSKRSELDGSGKATLRRAAGQRTPGMLFEIPKEQCRALDRAEGVGNGYDRCDAFPVHQFGSDTIIKAVTYLATSPEPNLKPFDWYLALIVAGAHEHGLDEDYLAKLSREPYMQDVDCNRKTRNEAIVALKAATFPDYRTLLG